MKVGFTDIRSRFYRRILRVIDKQYIFDFGVYIWYLMLYAYLAFVKVCLGSCIFLEQFSLVFRTVHLLFVLQNEFVDFRIDL